MHTIVILLDKMSIILKCNICGKPMKNHETNDSFPINYIGESALYGCCNECNSYVVKCRNLLINHPDYLTTKFNKLLTIDEIKQICK